MAEWVATPLHCEILVTHMANDWVAIGAGTDRRNHARRLARAHDQMAAGDGHGKHSPELVRSVIQRSWNRSTAAGVDPGSHAAPIVMELGEAGERWERHPLALAVPILRGLLDEAGDEEHVALVCDADGTLLWLDGAPSLVDGARDVHLQVGSTWAERAAGTNAMGTALAEEHAVQVFSAEHFSSSVHEWTCSAAPVHDPHTGALLGVIDLTGSLKTAHPHSLAAITLAARTVEAELGKLGRPTLLSDGAPDARPRLQTFGRDRGELDAGNGVLRLSRRHTELLLLLHLFPEGLSAEQLALEVYGERGRPGSVRAELHRLRAQLPGLVGERPYRLLQPLDVDADGVAGELRDGLIASVLDGYDGPPLPRTEVPRLVELRERVDDALRAAVLGSGSVDLLERWLRTPSGRDDFEASRALITTLERSDPRRAAERPRLARLARQSRD